MPRRYRRSKHNRSERQVPFIMGVRDLKVASSTSLYWNIWLSNQVAVQNIGVVCQLQVLYKCRLFTNCKPAGFENTILLLLFALEYRGHYCRLRWNKNECFFCYDLFKSFSDHKSVTNLCLQIRCFSSIELFACIIQLKSKQARIKVQLFITGKDKQKKL